MGLTEINCGSHHVNFGTGVLATLQSHLEIASPPISQCVILCDTNTYKHCLPELLIHVPRLEDASVLEIPAGEQSKTVVTAQNVWKQLAAHHLDRNALLINLGGGVVSDLGGFCASTYKRGIRFVNVPTSLMGMVDAAIGGKTGVDLDQIKNMVGTFTPPKRVYVHVPFLKTLSKRHLLNGLAEMMKHALIKDEHHWQGLKRAPLHNLDQFATMILHSAGLKAQVVLEDPNEQGIRKILNFGHTIGHAVESLSLESDRKELLHGEAIAIGMICEAYISMQRGAIDTPTFNEIKSILSATFPSFPIQVDDHLRLVELIRHDKKNAQEKFQFTLLDALGQATFNQEVTTTEVRNALEHYRINLA